MLYLTPSKILYTHGGVVVNGTASMIYKIIGGEARLISISAEVAQLPDDLSNYVNYPLLPIQVSAEKVESDERGSVLIDDVRYYTFYYPPDTEDYNDAFLDSETIEEFHAAIGYDQTDYPERYENDAVYLEYLSNGSSQSWDTGTQ